MCQTEGAAVAGDEERHFAFAHQKYRSVKYREASEHGNIVYEKITTNYFLELLLSVYDLVLAEASIFYPNCY